MSLVNLFTLDLDLKDNNYISGPVVTSNDTIVFVVNITDDGIPFDLSSMTAASIGHARPDGIVVLKMGTRTGPNQISFGFGSTETAVPGRVDAKVQVYDADGRVSTLDFGYTVTKDPFAADYIPSTNEKTLIEQVLMDGPQILADAEVATTNANNAADNANASVANIQTAENTRVSQENTRKTNETARTTAESTRATQEGTRVTNETARTTAESTRASQENTRKSNETTRTTAENARATQEGTRQNNETTRQSNESARQTNNINISVWEAYDNAKAYVPLNKVVYKGSSYICIADSTGNLPAEQNTAYWTLIAKKGLDGMGSVVSVNGVLADDSGNVSLTASDIDDAVRLSISDTAPPVPTANSWWYEDLGETIDFGGGGLVIGNASMGGGELIWFETI